MTNNNYTNYSMAETYFSLRIYDLGICWVYNFASFYFKCR